MFFSLFLILFIVCFVAWLLGGFVFHVAGGLIHILRRTHLLGRAFCKGPPVRQVRWPTVLPGG